LYGCVLLPQGDHSAFADAMEFFLRREATAQLSAGSAGARLDAIANDRWLHWRVQDIPRQQDSFNCGVFAMVFADCISVAYPIQLCPLNADALEAARAHLADALLEVS
jgi:hypothetical protein